MNGQREEVVVIRERAARAHDLKCARKADCSSREWHINNDYIARARRERVTELRAAASELNELADSLTWVPIR